MTDDAAMITLGKFSGVFGVKGWIKVYPYTEQVENILDYTPWQIQRQGQWSEIEIAAAQKHKAGLIVKLSGCDDRDQAAAYVNAEIAVPRQRLPELSADEYYWSDLQGLQVYTEQDVYLGNVDHLLETGANDVLVVKDQARERLLPYLPDQVVKQIDLTAGRITVDWDPEF